MRHGMKGRKFGRTASQRKAMFHSLARSLIEHGSIQTTLPKAKDLRPIVERMVTRARHNTLHVRRHLIAYLRDPAIVERLMSTIAPRFLDRPGGYTRIVKAGVRQGDNAPMAVIQWVDTQNQAEGGVQGGVPSQGGEGASRSPSVKEAQV